MGGIFQFYYRLNSVILVLKFLYMFVLLHEIYPFPLFTYIIIAIKTKKPINCSLTLLYVVHGKHSFVVDRLLEHAPHSITANCLELYAPHYIISS